MMSPTCDGSCGILVTEIVEVRNVGAPLVSDIENNITEFLQYVSLFSKTRTGFLFTFALVENLGEKESKFLVKCKVHVLFLKKVSIWPFQ